MPRLHRIAAATTALILGTTSLAVACAEEACAATPKPPKISIPKAPKQPAAKPTGRKTTKPTGTHQPVHIDLDDDCED